ncbi:hypothetical protein JB92DRAFT_2975107 [Gautieria morchelliformis]|nr:hypothetical protein JB92DRAFT_2975107 [Gautieria morchelliformis]
MYVRLRAASTKPSVCLPCTFLSPHNIPSAAVRGHTTRAQTALKPPPTASPDAQPVSGYRRLTVDAALKTKRKRRTAAENEVKSARQALKEAQETERRRKALATLDKTTKFVAAGLNDLHEPTLEDLDRFKPNGPPPITLDFVYPDPTSPSYLGSPSPSAVERYTKAFGKHVDTLVSKFQRKQLWRLYKEGMQDRTSSLPGAPKKKAKLKTTQDVAGEIVRWLWHWPYVSEVEEQVSYMTSRSEREFLISASEFFLLLGSDGSSLRALTESYGVLIKRVKRTNDSFTLVVEGLSYMLDQLALVITEHKKRIMTELIHLKSSDETSRNSSPSTESNFILPDLTQRISKLTNALVEDMGNGMYRLSADHARNITISKRLVIRMAQQNQLPIPLMLAQLSTSEDSTSDYIPSHIYALFPFDVTNPDSLPFYWIPTNIPSRSSEAAVAVPEDPSTSSPPSPHHFSGTPYVYRVRKVCDWLGQTRNGAMGSSSLTDSIGEMIDSTGQPQSLREALGLPDLDSVNVDHLRQVKITARFGHFVFAPAAGLKSLLPPLRGSWRFSKFFDWIRVDAARMTFIPELPNTSINSSPLSLTILSRLVYRSSTLTVASSGERTEAVASPSTSTTLRFEVILPQSTWREQNSEPSAQEDRFEATVRTMYNQQDTVTGPRLLSDEHSSVVQPSQMDTPSSPPETPRSSSDDPVRLWKGVETVVNIMLPDRPMDMQLSSFESTPIPSDSEPPELRDYASGLSHCLRHADLSSRPIPPLHVAYEGIRYVLDTDATVQSSTHLVTDFSTTEQVDVTVENAVDVESNHQVDSCFVACSEPNAASTWHKFLGACDRLTWLRARRETTHSVVYPTQDCTSDET